MPDTIADLTSIYDELGAVYYERRTNVINNETARVLAKLLSKRLHALELLKDAVNEDMPLSESSPESRLLVLIDGCLFQGSPSASPWVGKASALETLLCAAGPAASQEAEELLSHEAACGKYLSMLSRAAPERVMRLRKTSGCVTIWLIKPPHAEVSTAQPK